MSEAGLKQQFTAVKQWVSGGRKQASMPLLLSLAKHPSVATVSSLARLHCLLLVPAAD